MQTRMTKNQLSSQAEILEKHGLSQHFQPGKDMVERVVGEIKLCHGVISNRNETINKIWHEMALLAKELESLRGMSRWEHFKRAVWF